MDLKSTALGIELGSTRIKAVLIDKDHIPVASGDYEWENQLVNGIWTYSMDKIHEGIQTCFANLKADVKEKFGITLDTTGAIGISAMIHGYLPFDKDGRQLTEFRTWRNTITGEAAEKLTAELGFNIPQRWSIAHYYQAILNNEPTVHEVDYLTTLAGYIHWKLTGRKVMGVGEASGMFPIDSGKCDYDEDMVVKFNALAGVDLRQILPAVLPAGADAGTLTEEGARFLDPSGDLKPGIPLAPCEGDAGTGMVATNSVRVRTGNVSAGTSDFAMIVVDHPLGVHRQIDMVTTPDGAPVAMVHCNNCTSDINAWVSFFGDFAALMGINLRKRELFPLLFNNAFEGDPDCGGVLAFNYISGEGVTDLDEGRPIVVRTPDSKFTLANFMRSNLYSAIATLKIGLDILFQEEHVEIDRLLGHGGFFKTPLVGQKVLSAAVNAPVSVMETAGEGGPYGMALLAAFMIDREEGESLPDYLDKKVFAGAEIKTVMADKADVEGFAAYLEAYKRALPLEKCATEVI